MVNFRLILYFFLAVGFLAFSLFWRRHEAKPNEERLGARIEANLLREITQLDHEALDVMQAIHDSVDWPASKHFFILFDSARVVRWSNEHMVSDVYPVRAETLSLITIGGSYFVVKSFPLEKNASYINGYILVQQRYAIQNQYLRTKLNQALFPTNEMEIHYDGTGTSVKFGSNRLFGISVKSTAKVYSMEWLGWITLAAGVFFLLLVTWKSVVYIKSTKYYWVTPVLVFIALLAIRMIMVYGEYPGNLKSSAIFDSDYFASSTFNNSIGNFFVNTIAFLIVAWSTYVLLKRWSFRSGFELNPFWRFFGLIFFLLLSFGFHLLPFLYLETIFHNSNITTDVSRQLYFDWVRILAFACVVLSNLTGYYFFNVFVKGAVSIAHRQYVLFLLALTLVTMGMVVFYTVTDHEFGIPVFAAVIHILILYIGFVRTKFRILVTRKFSVFFLALIILGIQAALAVRILTIERQQKTMLRYANSFLVERDILGEYLMEQTVSNIQADVFIQKQFTNPFNRLTGISQKIKRSHLSTYFDQYEVRVNLFDAHGRAMGNDTLLSLDSLKKSFVNITPTRDDFFIGRQFSVNNLNHYLTVIPVQATLPGFVVLDLALREVSPATVFPRLLLDDRFGDYAAGAQYSHAIYQNGNLQNSAGSFKYELHDFKKLISDPRLFNGGLAWDGYDHVGLEDWSGRVAIVSTKQYSFFNVIANFSFLFLLGLITCFVAFVLVNFHGIGSQLKQVSYSNRIQLYVYGALILPLVIIGATTLRLNYISEREHAETENMSKAERLAKNLTVTLVQNSGNLQDEVLTQAKAVGVDVTVFSPTGILLATSQPEIYSSQLMSKLIKSEALKEIKCGNYLFTVNDAVGELRFQNTYAAMRAPASGELLAILSAPFFESQQEGEMNLLRLASIIWTVSALVFLGFYLLSFVALSWLTKPLQVIATSLRRTTLSGTNRKLSWNSRDEIGAMVSEYNRMVDNLEVSKAELARKQREAVWREMARQVAHEIKNPLTPIKLTLQKMEMAMLRNREGHEKDIESIKTVLHHVDILNGIASSFSAFAQMPEMIMERVNINQLIEQAISLYDSTTQHTISYDASEKEVWVMADPKLFLRIFGNIILNAFQAGGKAPIIITIRVVTRGSLSRITFSDNGSGMAPDVLDKIFIPYFSTKESGSGLGLAIAKQGVEQSGGKIWCESKEGQGTTFFIELPIVQ